ncbi:hypothetical protein KSX_24900 [Ktedonospora formicarum]|uniref:Uncharacterized protein n=1 Tax=Ktedonospora formicarum TaxID=2778364 RepID=A0A8J3HUL7_9CHLR|nr:hypothetical protein KSX_24900 [Ktedonospora formicarum]
MPYFILVIGHPWLSPITTMRLLHFRLRNRIKVLLSLALDERFYSKVRQQKYGQFD